jgi:hypothetical protein
MLEIQVDSSVLQKLRYKTNQLEVTFKDGKIYVYHGVSPEVFEVVCRAESKGKAFNNLIKPVYEFERIK